VHNKYLYSFLLIFIYVLFTANYTYATDSNNSNEIILAENTETVQTDNEKISETIIEATHEFFYDVPVSHYAYESINNLYNIGAINYREAYKYSPDALISRAEFVHMLLSTVGIISFEQHSSIFKDVDPNDPYASYIDIAYRLGIVDGVGNDQFKPGDPVKRDALIKMIITASGKLDVKWSMTWRELNSILSKFNDKDKFNDFENWSPHYISFALKNNLINGYPDNTIRPNQNTTRAEAAVIINRLFATNNTDNKNKSGEVSLLASSVNDYPFKYTKELDMVATKYNSNEPGLSQYTASGLKTRVGVVAVDRNIIPLGTHLYVEGYGFAVAADTGGAIRGNKIDLYAASVKEANQFGRQNVKVFILP